LTGPVSDDDPLDWRWIGEPHPDLPVGINIVLRTPRTCGRLSPTSTIYLVCSNGG
jgi:hypothetical protein